MSRAKPPGYLPVFCLSFLPPNVLLLVLGLVAGGLGAEFGLTYLVWHDDPRKQFWVGFAFALVSLAALYVGFLLWAKKAGRPWEVAKAFEASAPCSRVVPAASIGHPGQGAVWAKVNGQQRQSGDLSQMIWKVPEMISYLSGLFTLQPGDLIFSGTPAGVGGVQRGDRIEAGVAGVGELSVKVV